MVERVRSEHNIRWRQAPFILGLLLSLLGGSLAGVAQAQATVTPNRIEITLGPGACADETVTVTLGETPIPQLDVALVIDVTGSMSDVIGEVTHSAGQIVADVRALVPDAAFALATLADYPAGDGLLSLFTDYGGPGDYPWRVDQDFTQDETRVQAALDNIVLMDGGDEAESYLRALYETQFLSWREGSRRIVVLFGDSYPHDPDPGRDESEGSADDLTLDEVTKELTAADITVLGVYTNEGVRSFYETVADQTGGQAFHMNRVEDVPQVIEQLIEATVTLIRTLTLEPTSPGDTWLRWEPDAHHDVASLEMRDFALALCVPEGTAGRDYTFDLTVTGDGAIVGRIPVLVHVPEPTPIPTSIPTSTPTPTPTSTPTPAPVAPPPLPGGFCWWWLLIPVLLLPLLTALWWWSRRSAPAGPPVKPGSRPGSAPPGRPVQKPAPRPGGADITHDRGRPDRRR